MKHFNKIYIGGKISGLTPAEFHLKFDKAKTAVQYMHPKSTVIIPTELCEDDWDWEHCMDVCLDTLWNCDCIYLMPDWKSSRGSFIEKKIAEKLGIQIYYL